MTCLTLYRFFQYANGRGLASASSAFKARVGRPINRLSSVRVILSSGRHVTSVCRFLGCVRRGTSIFRVGANNEFIRSMRYLTNVALKGFNDGFRALAFSTQGNDKTLSRLSMARSCTLWYLSLIRGLERILRRLCYLISNRIRCVNSTLSLMSCLRHFAIMTLTITCLAECVSV